MDCCKTGQRHGSLCWLRRAKIGSLDGGQKYEEVWAATRPDRIRKGNYDRRYKCASSILTPNHFIIII
jgi:hypothetical protein